MPENIVGIIERLRDGGLTRYSIVFTNRRIIAAKAENLKKALFSILFSGLMASSKYQAGRDAVNGIANSDEQADEKIRNSDPDTILEMDKHNLSIPYDNLSKIEMSLWPNKSIQVDIFTDDGKEHNYVLSYSEIRGVTSEEAFDVYVNMIRQVAPDKIITK